MHACGKGFTHINYTKYHYGSGDPLPCDLPKIAGREGAGERGGGGKGREGAGERGERRWGKGERGRRTLSYTQVNFQEANYT